MLDYGFYNTVFGDVIIASREDKIVYLQFADEHEYALRHMCERFMSETVYENNKYLHNSVLTAFMSGKTLFDVVELSGTPFQLNVWHSTMNIPKGKTVTYADVARDINNPKAYRAVGHALALNPVLLLVPCHRVVPGHGNNYGHYAGGDQRKKALLKWESN